MEYLLYMFTGFAAAALGALPPGAVNLSVVYTTVNQSAKAAIPIILSAAFGEIVLSLFALHCSMAVEDYISNNVYIQYTIALLLITVGLILFLKRFPQKTSSTKNRKNNSLFKGLLLAILNPPVLVFWLVAFTFIATHTEVMVQMGLIQLVVLFFIGVFIGKIFTLWVYMQLSKTIAKKANDITEKVNRGIALLLTGIGLFQLVGLLV